MKFSKIDQSTLENRLLTQQEREDAMRAAGQLQRETDQPVSIFAEVCIAQDAKTAKFFQVQVDIAKADAERSMAAYKDLYTKACSGPISIP